MSLNVISDIPAWHKLALYLVAIQWTCVLFQVDLNKVKSSLSDLDISKWHDHTQQMNPAGQVIYHLRKKCHLELSTQAWCKFHEIVASFPLVQLHGPEVNTLHLCEAPGAFISSFNHFLYNSGAILYIFILHCQQHWHTDCRVELRFIEYFHYAVASARLLGRNSYVSPLYRSGLQCVEATRRVLWLSFCILHSSVLYW